MGGWRRDRVRTMARRVTALARGVSLREEEVGGSELESRVQPKARIALYFPGMADVQPNWNGVELQRTLEPLKARKNALGHL